MLYISVKLKALILHLFNEGFTLIYAFFCGEKSAWSVAFYDFLHVKY